MPQVDFHERQLTIKLVYYGPALSGKTTNLQQLHARVDALNRGRLMTLDTRDDRTLFFDLLPIFFKTSALSFRIKVYTVPGQPMHAATRRVVLQGADGVAFVADSRRSAAAANAEAYAGLLDNMERLALSPTQVPVVVQYNKRDLPDVIDETEMVPLGGAGQPVVGASAIAGDGVVPTFLRLVDATYEAIDRDASLGARFGVSRDDFGAAIRQHLALKSG